MLPLWSSNKRDGVSLPEQRSIKGWKMSQFVGRFTNTLEGMKRGDKQWQPFRYKVKSYVERWAVEDEWGIIKDRNR